ncbi:exported hypothetical protein [Cupriavidus taiwanensis]|uniref:Uncharacterized protein n=1 Tax=Cupriavidus taiwanensis TaxID=164546 RepID=A0A975XDJ4_9BURK|nr:exported hypothetical protein [Cupriavidus taiwanensis]
MLRKALGLRRAGMAQAASEANALYPKRPSGRDHDSPIGC